MVSVNDLRNIVLLGHNGCGKTSLAEAILFKSGATNRLGNVDDGSSVCDYDDEEKTRKNSIHSALTYFNHAGKTINLIDTPGSPNFMSPALLSIPAVETAAIVISASSGIEVNTRKLYAVAETAGKAKFIIVNKIDAENADIEELLKLIGKTFGSQCRCANLPSKDKHSVIDCIVNDKGESLFDDVATVHTSLIESVIEADEKLMEKYLGGEDISSEQIKALFVKAMLAGTVVPILFTNAKEQVGIKEVMDFIAEYAASPVDLETKLITDQTANFMKPDPSAPLAGLVFRVGFDPRSNMKYASIRLFSGTLKSDTPMHHNADKKIVRPGHLLKMFGAEHKEIAEASAGDIVTLAKLEELLVGDFINDGKLTGKIELPQLPKPMFSLTVEPAARGDETKIGSALEKLKEEDLCFTVSRDSQTHELVMHGLGDLHLRIMLAKMEHRFKLKVITKQPKIPHRETISVAAEGHYKHKKQTGGAGQFGEVYLKVEPAPRGSNPPLVFSWDIFGGSIPGQFEAPIIKGIHDVMDSGYLAGYPMQDIKVSVYDGKHHPVDSKEVAFRAAGKGAFIDAVSKAKPVLLEPLVIMEITVPSENVGDITGDISSKRGRIEGQDVLPGGMVCIKAKVPLEEVKQYDSHLKSITAGQGSYSMELSHYEPVPPNVQQQIVEQHQKEKVAEKE